MPPQTVAQLNFFLHEGAVFYLQDRALTSAAPHFFVILNHKPTEEDMLLLVVSSSQVVDVKELFSCLPADTLVEITRTEYAEFTKDSIISCNQVFKKTKQQLLDQMRSGGIQLNRISAEILAKLRYGVLVSPMVERNIKSLLKAEHQL